MSATVSSAASAMLLDLTAGHDAVSWFVSGGEATFVQDLSASHPEATIHWQPVDVREREAGAARSVQTRDPGSPLPRIAAALIAMPPDRDLARRWLLQSLAVVEPRGTVFLAGANVDGVRPAIADAARLFGPSLREGYGRKQRFAVFGAPESTVDLPDWVAKPGVAPGSWDAFILDTGGGAVELVTQAGVFAGAKVDAGTRLLLEALPERIAGRVLDIGCGAGAIGIAAALRGAVGVTMTDVNLLAVQAAAENICRLGLSNSQVIASDVYAAIGEDRYDLIVSNPPFHRGKAVDSSVADRLIDEAPNHLLAGGELLVVANAFLAYGKRMTQVFRRVETVTSTRQYHVIRASDPIEG